MPPDLQSKWRRLEGTLKKATHTLLARYNIGGGPPPLPSTFGYMSAHATSRDLTWALERSKESFSLWIGALSFAIALSAFIDPKAENPAIPKWYSALREAGLHEVWMDGLRTSSMMRFDGSILRVGTILDILSPQVN